MYVWINPLSVQGWVFSGLGSHCGSQTISSTDKHDSIFHLPFLLMNVEDVQIYSIRAPWPLT